MLYAPDLPSYLARCAEYALPMIVSGAVGGYFFSKKGSERYGSDRSSKIGGYFSG
jgi:hypothetical protein